MKSAGVDTNEPYTKRINQSSFIGRQFLRTYYTFRVYLVISRQAVSHGRATEADHRGIDWCARRSA